MHIRGRKNIISAARARGRGFTAAGERREDFRRVESEFSYSNFVLIKIRSSSLGAGARPPALSLSSAGNCITKDFSEDDDNFLGVIVYKLSAKSFARRQSEKKEEKNSFIFFCLSL